MATPGPLTETVERAHIDVTSEEFERRLAAHGHDADEIRHLWGELAIGDAAASPVTESRGRASERRLGFGPVIAVYLGLLLVVAASVSLLAIYWGTLGPTGVLALAAAYLAGYLVAADVLRRRELVQPADVLEAVAVGWAGLTTYAILELTDVWPAGATDLGRVHVGLTTISIVTLAASAILLFLRPDPLLFVPMGAATGVLAVDLAEVGFGQGIDDLSSAQVGGFLLPVGLAWIAAGLWLDVTRRRNYATWAHLVGLVVTSIAIVAIVPKTVPGFALIGILGALALFFSAFVRHWSFTVTGALGVLMATMSAMSLLGGIAPLVIAVVGLGLIVVGLRWSRWRVSIRNAVLDRMPPSARSFVSRLAP